MGRTSPQLAGANTRGVSAVDPMPREVGSDPAEANPGGVEEQS
jgi:hypothetical protein